MRFVESGSFLRASSAFSLILLAGASLAGCEPATVAAIGSSGLVTVDDDGETAADPQDPFGSCEIDPDRARWDFVCSSGGVDCTGWGNGDRDCDAPGCHVIGYTFHMVCDHTCETAADCPVPLTGNALPACSRHNGCELPCDESTQCPNGFSCQSTTEWGLFDEAGNHVPAPFLCMQTFTLEGFGP